jgi:RHS repeat-associated protein
VVAEFTSPVLESAATRARTYTWGLDLSGTLQGAGGVGGLISVQTHDPQSSIHYPSYDGNGNIIAWTKSDGTAPVARREYDAFGNTMVAEGTAPCAFGFSTKMREEATGLYYYGYRFYDPLTGRWPSRDPIGVRGGLNLYTACLNSLLHSIDALGMVAYRLGIEDPQPSVDIGQGAEPPETPGIGDITQMGLILGVLDVLEGTMPEAVSHLRHYFGATAIDMPLDVKKLHSDVPSQHLTFKSEYYDAMNFAETLDNGRHNITSGKASAGGIDKYENLNWFSALGGYQRWGKGPLFVCKGNTNPNLNGGFEYQLNFEYKIFDRYNWDNGKFVLGGLITDRYMGKFHRMGLAAEFNTFGSRFVTLRWNEGQYDPVVIEGNSPSHADGSYSTGGGYHSGQIWNFTPPPYVPPVISPGTVVAPSFEFFIGGGPNGSGLSGGIIIWF